ncbi:MAG TPA: DUF305 domain-containing protein [Gemmatimonadaceae bacterium]|nr:DUF305 domain-containing protein [Gemmatimonadaceae bacterium]
MTDRPPAISRQLTTLALLALVGATVAACRSAAPPAASPAPAATTPAVAPVVVSTPDTTAASPVASSVAAADTAPHPQAAAPDVHFMHHMIMHHGQALTMTALVPTRTTRESMRLLAERITISQQGEIALMRRWLADRHAPDMSPDMHGMAAMGAMGAGHAAHHGGGDSTTMGGHAMAMPGMKMDSAGGMPMMPGMLTPAELEQLAKASGTAFDRLFLQFMIRHHEGALTMVKEYFSTPGAGRDPAAFRFASDVDADQRAEIARMRALARSLPNE